MSAAESPAAESPTGRADPSAPKPGQALRSCWSCRLLSGGGLLLAGAYVFSGARRVMRQGAPPSMGTVAQITFAGCLAAWGIVVIADPTGKERRVT